MTEENSKILPDGAEAASDSEVELVNATISSSEETEEDAGQIPLFAERSNEEEQMPLWNGDVNLPRGDISAEEPMTEQIFISEDLPATETAEDVLSVSDVFFDAEEQAPAVPSIFMEESSEPPVFDAEYPSVSEEYGGSEIPQRRRRSAEEVGAEQGTVERKVKRKVGSAVSPFVEFVEIIVGALVAAILVLTLICRTGVVEGDSMLPTMYGGDRYIISDLFYTPEQGDIVVFRPEIDGKDELWIKRVIAVEGQKVYIDPDSHRVYVNDVLLNEPYLQGMGTVPHSTQNPIVVPAGCVYVLGDNRAISHDSRYEDLGCVEIGQLAGRVILRFWPLESFGFCE